MSANNPQTERTEAEREWDAAYDEAMQWRDWQTCDILINERETADWYLGRERDGD